jgi:hypothetical protein
MYHRLSRNCLPHCIHQLIGGEPPHHGDDAIVTANGMESKGKRGEPEASSRDPAPPEIADDHSNARDPVHLAQELERVGACKVMQNLRAHHYVDAVIREGKPQRIATNGERQDTAAGAGQLERRIEPHGRQLDAHLQGNFPRPTGDVAKACSDVEQSRLRRYFLQSIPKLIDGRAQPPEQGVRANDICQRSPYELGIDVRTVEYLEPASSGRGED